MRAILCVALLLVPARLAAQAPQPAETPRTINVNAYGTIEREPDQGVIVVAVESEAPTARAAAEMNASRMTELVAALRRAGVAERSIRTVSYELRPEYAREDRGREPPRIVAYRAVNMVQVTTDTVARLGGLIDAAIGSGANRVTSIQFRLRDRQAAHLEAVAVAVRNARREAEALAAAAGERLGPVMNIGSGGFAPVPPPMPYARADVMEMAMAATPIEGGTLSVTASVNVTYRLLDE
jgi:uncharacterized protein